MTSPAAYQDSYRRRTVCITGGAGFIGSHLCDALVGLGAQVRILDDFSNGRVENLQGAASKATVVRGSITDASALDQALAGCSVVFHQAALGSVPRSIEIPEQFHEVNVTGTVRVMEAARRHGATRVVYAASSSAYGNTQVLPKIESMKPDTLSPYAYTKLAAEYILRSWGNCYGMQTVSLRYFNIFGPRQREDSQYAAVIPVFAKHLRQGTRPIIYGDGGHTRDFTHVANAVHANLLAGSTRNALCGQVVNVACGGKFSLLQLLESMAAILNVKANPEFRPERAGDVKESLADIQAAEQLLGYRVIVPFEEGLRQTLLG
jgi:UDP-glucose 4-epimerase